MQVYLVKVFSKFFLNPEVVELTVVPVKPKIFKFKPGQFVFFDIGGAWKAYSMASVPEDKGLLRFVIKLEPNGRGSRFISALRAGETLEFSGPEGEFVVRGRSKELYCIAAGIGIAPFLSIIPRELSKNRNRNITLLYGARTGEDLLYKKQWQKYMRENPNFTFIPVLTKPGVSWEGKKGYLSEYIKNEMAVSSKAAYYLCGKTGAVESVENALLGKGLDEDLITTEVFLQ